MSLTIQAFHTEDAFTTLHDEWRELHASSSRSHIFMTWEWQSNWWAAYHPGRLWIIAVRNEQRQLIGLAPWFIDENHPKGRLVRSIGCVEVTDYLELILREGCEGEVLQALTDHVAPYRGDCYDALDFCNIPGDSPILDMWIPILEAAGYTVTVKQQEVCPIIRLPDSWEGYLQQLDKKQRHEVRRKMRRMAGSGLSVEWQYITDDIQAGMERFLHLMRASSPDKAEFLNDPQNVDFFYRVTPVMADCGWLLLSFLQLNGEDAAAYLSFNYNNRIMLYNSGLDPENHPELSPGIILLAYIIQDAIERGSDIFDFLRGNEEYKYRMGGVDTPVMMIHAK